jgi:nucleoporin NUP82
MPRIKSFAPAWLNEPAPGHKLFEQPVGDSNHPAHLAYSKKSKPGPRRTIARRGTEVFVAVGKQIRWGDLARLKETWESSRHGSGIRVPTQDSSASFEVYDEEAAAGNTGSPGEGYRVSDSSAVALCRR